jgi:hypothetical protein
VQSQFAVRFLRLSRTISRVAGWVGWWPRAAETWRCNKSAAIWGTAAVARMHSGMPLATNADLEQHHLDGWARRPRKFATQAGSRRNATSTFGCPLDGRDDAMHRDGVLEAWRRATTITQIMSHPCVKAGDISRLDVLRPTGTV